MRRADVAGPTGAGRSLAGLVACAVGGAVVLVLLGLRLGAIVPRDGGTATRTGIDRWVEITVLTVGAAATAWLTLGALVALACVAVAPRHRARAVDTALGRWTPRVVRRLARGAVGLGVGAGLALAPTAALADEPVDTPATVLDVGWRSTADVAPDRSDVPEDVSAHPIALEPRAPSVPDPQVGGTSGATAEEASVAATTSSDAAPASRATTGPDAAEVVVHRGDSLWEIAARGLPASATDAEVLAATTRWHEANRDVIGADPDAILPGQVLRAP
ncbi:hypothetical protein [Isoptericola haloaureus]|uniref:LysM domain-containing protein n=1 Tax=Isoptericola haloaureus TaxID=1542902 RepID=A0ABU7ZAE4_9MICO